MKKILILGSINIDLTIETPYIPAAGETVTGRNFLVNPGGKGANQAVAARRLGGTVCFSGCVGDDAFGRESMENFQRCGLDISGVRTVENCPTGCAVIAVCGGDNRIILDRGANAAVTCADADALIGRAAAGDIFLTQLEIDLSVAGYALRRAKESGLYTVLNPAPADGRIVRYFPYVDLIAPNESELALLTGESDCARGAAKLAVPEVVVTRGKKGYYYAGKSGSFYGGCPAGNPAYFAEDNCLIERGEMRMIIGNRQGSIPDGVKVLGRETVSACADLTDLSIPASVERIESGAVARCPALEGILFAADSRLKEIDSGSFSNCPGLKPQVFGNAVYFGAEDNPFFVLLKVYDTDTDFVQIHEDTKVIAARAFSGYENDALREILLPEGLRSIGAAAFDGAGLTNVFLPATIEHMGSDVFRDCAALKTVVCDLFTRPDGWERDWLGAAQAEVLWLTHAHVYGEWTCDKGEHWRICSVCDKTERGAHTFADGRCTACGVHESISALRFSLAAGAAYAGQRRFKVAQSLDGIRAS